MSDPLSGSPLAWLGLVGGVAVLLAIDLLVVRGRGGHMSLRFAAAASGAWVARALGVALLLLVRGERAAAGDYLAGYLVEKSLSLDNVFVFLLVLGAFGVAEAERHRLLSYGIAGALVLRAAFIVVGAAALDAASWLAFVFAAFLVYTGVRMLRHRHDHDGEQALVARLRGRFRIADGAPGRLVGRAGGRRALTASGAALAALVAVDVLFAVDSVPAILAITSDTFIVFAANAFALLGLRPLFFLVAELVARLYYLKTALAVLLVFIGGKMAASELFGKIAPEYSLPAIAVILGTGVAASLLRERGRRPVPDPA